MTLPQLSTGVSSSLYIGRRWWLNPTSRKPVMKHNFGILFLATLAFGASLCAFLGWMIRRHHLAGLFPPVMARKSWLIGCLLCVIFCISLAILVDNSDPKTAR